MSLTEDNISGVGAAISDLRTQANITAEQLARKTHTDLSLLERIESNEEAFPLRHIATFAKALNMRPEQLMLRFLQCKHPSLTSSEVGSELDEMLRLLADLQRHS